MRSVTGALVAATRDPDPRVRQSAATALGRLTLSGTTARDLNIRLREIARMDPSLIVRGAALASDILLEKNGALPLARQMMAEQVWQNVIRTAAVNALKVVGTPEALQLAAQYAAAAQ
jgi:HEAT repeat protein